MIAAFCGSEKVARSRGQSHADPPATGSGTRSARSQSRRHLACASNISTARATSYPRAHAKRYMAGALSKSVPLDPSSSPRRRSSLRSDAIASRCAGVNSCSASHAATSAGWSERARSEGGDSEAGYASTVSTDATVSGKTSDEEDDAGDGSAVSTQLGEPDDVRRCAIRILDWT